MSDAELAREIADKFLGDWIGSYDPDESRWIMCKGALAKLLMQIQYKARLDEAKWWNGTWGALRKCKVRANRIAALEQAAGGSAAGSQK